MKKHGQALVEFIIILPIFLLLVFGIFDIGKILYNKIILEQQISEVITLYQKGKDPEEIKTNLDLNKDVTLNVESDNDYLNFNLTKEVDIITPGLNLIFNNPYELKITRSILNE